MKIVTRYGMTAAALAVGWHSPDFLDKIHDQMLERHLAKLPDPSLPVTKVETVCDLTNEHLFALSTEVGESSG